MVGEQQSLLSGGVLGGYLQDRGGRRRLHQVNNGCWVQVSAEGLGRLHVLVDGVYTEGGKEQVHRVHYLSHADHFTVYILAVFFVVRV